MLINAAIDNLDFPCVATAAALLVNQMGTVVAHPEELLLEPELVVRDSTGPRPCIRRQKITVIS